MSATILPFPAQHRRPLPTKGELRQDARLVEIARRAAEKFSRDFGKALAPGLAEEIARAIRDAD